MGPGFHAQIEADFFAESKPEIDFWNQPLVGDRGDSLSTLSQQVIEKLKVLKSDNNNKPVDLIAHSVGGLLALNVLKTDASLVQSCHFFSTGVNYPQLFLNLMKVLSKKTSVPEQAKDAIRAFRDKYSEITPQNLLEAAGILMTIPEFTRFYWASAEKYDRYQEVALKYAPLDVQTFLSVSSNILDQYPSLVEPSPFKGEVNITLGEKDPLLDLKEESKIWKRVFPQAKLKIMPGVGHFVHYEAGLWSGF